MSLFRCPNPDCGQAHEMKVTEETIITQDKPMEVTFLNGEQADNLEVSFPENPDIACGECREAHPFEDWLTAGRDPLQFFEMEELCHCGGELYMEPIPLTRNYGFTCERCNWVKPKKTVNGGV